jgi:hypothetical protein
LNQSFAPLGLICFLALPSRLAPWTALFRRFAAGRLGLCPPERG